MTTHISPATPRVSRRVELGSVPRALVPVGRALFAAIFILSSFHHFSAGTIAYAAQHHVPLASVAVPLSGVVALVGGLSILLGFHARIGAWLVVLFLVLVTPAMHDFWNVADPMMRADQMAHFLKNVALLGGALLIAYYGSGPVSVDEPRRS
jgi:putative oxidoreductase